MKKCPDCGGKLDIDVFDGVESETGEPCYEVVCYGCGYFVREEFQTEETAVAYIEGSE